MTGQGKIITHIQAASASKDRKAEETSVTRSVQTIYELEIRLKSTHGHNSSSATAIVTEITGLKTDLGSETSEIDNERFHSETTETGQDGSVTSTEIIKTMNFPLLPTTIRPSLGLQALLRTLAARSISMKISVRIASGRHAVNGLTHDSC